MRDIEFRGKDKATGKWVFGDLIHDIPGNPMINTSDGDDLLVIPETVGEYTGLFSKNGVKIFEGDIVKSRAYGIKEIAWGNKSIDYLSGCCGFMYDRTIAYLNKTDSKDITIIGNIHDNSELLEVNYG